MLGGLSEDSREVLMGWTVRIPNRAASQAEAAALRIRFETPA